jgi:hypothetical protein
VVFELPLRLATVQLARFFNDMDGCFDREQPFAVVLDLTPTSLPCAAVRKGLAEYFKRNTERAHTYLVAEAVVVSSAPMKGLVDAINGAAPPQHPQRLFSNRGDAFRWSRRLLHDAGCAPAEYQLRKSGVHFSPASTVRSAVSGSALVDGEDSLPVVKHNQAS